MNGISLMGSIISITGAGGAGGCGGNAVGGAGGCGGNGSYIIHDQTTSLDQIGSLMGSVLGNLKFEDIWDTASNFFDKLSEKDLSEFLSDSTRLTDMIESKLLLKKSGSR